MEVPNSVFFDNSQSFPSFVGTSDESRVDDLCFWFMPLFLEKFLIVIYPCVSGYERMDVQFPFFLFNFPKDSERLQESVFLTKIEGGLGSDGGF